MLRSVFVYIILFSYLRICRVDCLTLSLEEIIQTYDSTTTPKLRGSITVNISLLINSLEVDDRRQMIRLSGEFQQEWDDIHLRFSSTPRHQNSVGLQGARGNRIKQHLWLPDVTLGHGFNLNVVVGEDFLLIDGDGHIVWTQQVLFEFPCQFDFSDYPVGKHTCKLKLQSIGYGVNEVEPRWAGEHSVYYSNTVVSLGYKLDSVRTSATTVVTIHRAKRQLQAALQLNCVYGWSVKHTVLPFVATVATAYLAFFINIRGITARITLCSVAFLIACIFHEATYDEAPKVPYTTGLEIFTGTCLTFIWLALIETVLVDVLSHIHSSYRTEHSEMIDDCAPPKRGEIAALWMDRCFRVLYPASFLAFNAVFWILYH